MSVTPTGGIMKLLGWVVGMIVGPLLITVGSGAWATYLALRNQYESQKSLSPVAWCERYGHGKCGSEPSESFDVVV